jgi:hypothetical protein
MVTFFLAESVTARTPGIRRYKRQSGATGFLP